jgi:hypothetical protein
LRRVFHFRIFAKIADENDFVHALCHEWSSFGSSI